MKKHNWDKENIVIPTYLICNEILNYNKIIK